MSSCGVHNCARKVTDRSLSTQKELYDLTRQRQAVGLTTDLDVVNAGAQLDSTQALVPQLDREVTQDINQLSLLMGRAPIRCELSWSRPGRCRRYRWCYQSACRLLLLDVVLIYASQRRDCTLPLLE